MALKQWYIYRSSDGYIENIIEYDDETDHFEPPTGYEMVVAPPLVKGKKSMCGIGWSYKNEKFIEPTK